MAKLVEILVSVKFNKRENKLFQHFQYGGQKSIKYLLDPRFLLGKLFNEKIMDLSLCRDKRYEYIEKKDEDGESVLIYETEEPEIPLSFYFKLVDFVPDNTGCANCIHRKIKDGEVVCEFQNNKLLVKELKTCRLFSQKRIFKS
jgi:hypothetical protein